MKKSPAEYFLKYLLSIHSFEDKDVMQKADELGIVNIPGGVDYLQHLRNNMKFPYGFDPMNENHRPSMEFIHSEGIYEMWFPTDATNEAVEFASTPEIREVVTALIAARAPLDRATQWLMEHLNIETSVKTLIEFRHYFWNLKLLTSTDIAALRASGGCSELISTASSLFKGELGPQTLMWKLGRMPTKVSRDDAIGAIRNISLFNALEVDRVMQQSSKKAATLRSYSETFFRAQAMLDESEEPDGDVISDFYRNITVGHEDFNPPTIDELRRGQEKKCEKTNEDTES